MNKKKEIAMIFVVIVAIALGVLIIILSSKGKAADKKQSDTSSETKTSVEIKPPKDKTEEESGLEITDDGTGLSPDESKVDEKNTEKGSKKSVETAESLKPTKSRETADSKNTSGYVQDANPETGISWDGKSHIVYIYLDGTKGSEKKNGAVYEVAPGVTRIYTEPDANEWDGTCAVCGKKAGDGKNGTCVRWLMSDATCPNCGAHVSQGKCHTCK